MQIARRRMRVTKRHVFCNPSLAYEDINIVLNDSEKNNAPSLSTSLSVTAAISIIISPIIYPSRRRTLRCRLSRLERALPFLKISRSEFSDFSRRYVINRQWHVQWSTWAASSSCGKCVRRGAAKAACAFKQRDLRRMSHNTADSARCPLWTANSSLILSTSHTPTRSDSVRPFCQSNTPRQQTPLTHRQYRQPTIRSSNNSWTPHDRQHRHLRLHRARHLRWVISTHCFHRLPLLRVRPSND